MLHFDLVDARQVILDRILGSNDRSIRPVEFIQSGVERRGFAGTGRSCHQKDTVRPLDDRLETLVVLVREAQLLNAHLYISSVQMPQHERLTVFAWDESDEMFEVLDLE